MSRESKPRMPPADESPPKPDEPFDEWVKRAGVKLPLQPAARRPASVTEEPDHYLEEARAARMRRHEQCKRALGDTPLFPGLAHLVSNLPPLRRERNVRDPVLREAERARALAEVWLYLSIGVATKRGRDSRWPDDRDGAVGEVGQAIAHLRVILGQHPSFKGLEDLPVVEDLAIAHQRLVAAFPPRVRGQPGRRRNEAKDQTEMLLVSAGVPPGHVEKLVRAAGLTEKTPRK